MRADEERAWPGLMARFWAGASLACVLLTPCTLLADGEVLHEYVPDLKPNEAALMLGAVDGQGAIEYDGEVITPPDQNSAAQDAPPFTATPGDGRRSEVPGQRSASFRPDRLTQLEGELDYFEAFTPAIAPFKRVTALDATTLDADGKTPLLSIGDARREEVKIETPDAEPPDARARDRFFGDVTLDFRAGHDVPLPSVSPESRILSMKTTPAIDLRIERDGADNFFARVIGVQPQVPVRLVFLTDAPRSYFGAEIPQVATNILSKDVPKMDASVARRALAFAHEIGLSEKDDLRTTLQAMTRYFREWTESAVPPPDTGDIYLDLVRGKKGVCRHRAYGFVVTAHALGIPTRFVQNEAHSWVEVKIPELGFLRIDLGGAAHGMTAHGADDKPAYTPATPDTLPRPESYAASYSTLGQGVKGMRPTAESVTGRWVGPASSGPDMQATPAFMTDSQATGTGVGAGAPGTNTRKPVTLALKDQNVTVVRGGKLALTGRLTNAAGTGIAQLRVEISIASTTRKERMLLGVTVSDEDGYFRAAVGVPSDLDVGDYKLVVLTPGNRDYLPVVAQ